MMAHLKSNMERIALPGTSPVGVDYITLSQGCCHCVPETKNRLWDYLATADKLLYQVKKDGKNNYKVGRWIVVSDKKKAIPYLGSPFVNVLCNNLNQLVGPMAIALAGFLICSA